PTYNLLLLPGDGIGPEVMAQVKKLVAWMNSQDMGTFSTEEGLCGGCAYDAHGVAVTDEIVEKAKVADAVIFGSVGGPKWDKVPYEHRPEAGLLRLRKDLQLYANLRPAVTYPALADASSLKRELVEGLDIMILRELTGGVYFGEPKTITDLGNGQKRAIDTQVYDTYEIERISRVAFELARKRRNKVTSMEKRNVMKTGLLAWGSLGAVDPETQKRKELYEPVRGSAPEIAGKGIANPIAMSASFAMALRYSCGMLKEADLIEKAIAAALNKGLRTADIAAGGEKTIGTTQMGDAIIAEVEKLAA